MMRKRKKDRFAYHAGGLFCWDFLREVTESMAGKRYKAKDRTVAKMERTGLTEENVRTGEKIRTSEGNTREISFDGRSDSGRQEAQAMQNAYASSSRSGSQETDSRRPRRSRNSGGRKADDYGSQEPFKSYSYEPYQGQGIVRKSAFLDDQQENARRQEDYSNIRDNQAVHVGSGESSRDNDLHENSSHSD